MAKKVRVNFALDEEVFDYIKTIGAARYGSMTAYIEKLVNNDRAERKQKDAKIKELLKDD